MNLHLWNQKRQERPLVYSCPRPSSLPRFFYFAEFFNPPTFSTYQYPPVFGTEKYLSFLCCCCLCSRRKMFIICLLGETKN